MATRPGIDQQFAVAVLRKWGRPVTATSVRNVLGWMAAEGGHTHNKAKFNFLNTTQPAPGAGNTGSQGNIKVYPDFNTGVDATVKTLKNGRYGAIAQTVNSDPSSFSRAVNQSPWGTKSDFSSISRSAKVDPAALSSQTAASPAASPMTQQQQPSVDGEKLLALLRKTSQQALQGKMPGPEYARQLGVIAQDARKAPNTQQVGAALTASGAVNVPAVGAVGNPVGSPVAGQKAQHASHQTSGLAGYPAYDYMAPAGTKVGAPVSGTVIRTSGKDPRLGGAPGGPLGYSIYLRGVDGKTYFLTHIDKLAVKVGQKVKQGQQIAVVANGPKSWSSPHVHMGVHG